MKPAILPVTLFGSLLLVPTLISDNDSARELPAENYIFEPQAANLNICGKAGAERGTFFKPELMHLLSSAAHAAAPVNNPVSLMPGLDGREFSISSVNPKAQAFFTQGFALMYGFNHWEAIRAFKKAQELDPECAICYWGEAMALGPNINDPAMGPEAVEQALTALDTALAYKDDASLTEAALIDALVMRYSDDETLPRAELDKRFAGAMAEVAAAFPEDEDIAVLYAEALMDTTPWDYWERDFTTPKPAIKRAITQIEKTLASNPDHYGAIHLLIHLYEASTKVKQAEPYADKLAGLAPGSGHLVHMPGHIYFRVGRYVDSLNLNVKAVAVDENYLNQTTGSAIYRYGYYPHNVHFVLVSAQMAGDAKTSLEYAGKIDKLIPLAILKEAEWIAPIKAASYFAYSQFASLDTVMGLEQPPLSQPYLKAMWHYARGAVLAEAGDDRALEEAEQIKILMGAEKVKTSGIPAATILELAGKTIWAKYHMAKGENDKAISLWQDAIVLQDSMPYMEPPFWYYAVEQSLGAALFKAGRFVEAERAFEASLIRHPNSAWSLYGLMRTQTKLGNTEAAAQTKLLLDKASVQKAPLPMMKL
ncbi:tetratricopeptide repeat protein [Kordiimonas pumila]|uniref:Tetratricopeptide repeat protein n=1 Tax=Kordiimonas pumila TaxID=2161677 RepID=A0ABV7D7C8_9PROT|nr:tetratricopeptide repeat protein [Kordiimonas pumila]